jgi:hypothetical protein
MTMSSAPSRQEGRFRPRQLAVQLATAAIASAAAALSLCARAGGDRRDARDLDSIAAVATAAHLVASLTVDTRRKTPSVAAPRAKGPAAQRRRDPADIVVAGVLPLALYGLARLAGGRSRKLPVLAAGVVLAGNYLSWITTRESRNQSPDHRRRNVRPARRKNLPALRSGDRARTTLQPT